MALDKSKHYIGRPLRELFEENSLYTKAQAELIMGAQRLGIPVIHADSLGEYQIELGRYILSRVEKEGVPEILQEIWPLWKQRFLEMEKMWKFREYPEGQEPKVN